MSFWEKIKMSVARFMQGRYGADEFGQALLWMGIALSLIEMFTGWILLGMLSMALFIWAIYRMFSRNTSRRFAENYRFLKLWNPVKNWFQWLWLSIRYCNKNRYFLCPKCRRIACVPKGTGRVTITCKGCKHKYDRKA